MLSAVFVVGCGAGEDSQGGQAHNHRQSPTANKLQLRPAHSSGVSGTASFEDGSDGLVVKLRLHDLPESDTLYLAHIHPGTCAELEAEEHHGEGQAHERGKPAQQEQGEGHQPGKEIEYPLSQVKSDSEGDGSSTTTLQDTSVEKLFSGVPRHLNVHEAGSGTPPILSCANLGKEQVGAEKQQGSHGQSHSQSHGQQAGHEQHPTDEACREKPEHLRVFNCEPMAMEGVEYDVQMQPERDRHTYEQTLANIDRVVPNELAIEVYFYSGERDYRDKYQNAVATLSVAGEYSVGQYGGSAPPMEGKLQRK